MFPLSLLPLGLLVFTPPPLKLIVKCLESVLRPHHVHVLPDLSPRRPLLLPVGLLLTPLQQCKCMRVSNASPGARSASLRARSEQSQQYDCACEYVL